MYDARADLKKQNKNVSVPKHTSLQIGHKNGQITYRTSTIPVVQQ